MVVIGSLRAHSVTSAALHTVAEDMQKAQASVDILDLREYPLPLYHPETAYSQPSYKPLQARVQTANAFLLGTPDYHGSISSTLKNFLDHFWKEFAGKLFATLVSSHEKGLTVHDQLRTVARQCNAWTLPYGVSLQDDVDVRSGAVVSDSLSARLQMLARDLVVYGRLLASQRAVDLAGNDPSFLARLRP